MFVLVSLILASLGPAAEVELSARIQHSAKFYRDRDGFMGLVAVQRDHHLIYKSGYGYANVESRRPFAADTRFPIGSVSKQFTSAAILLLQQDGKLKTSDPIHLYYENAPASWKSVFDSEPFTCHSFGFVQVDTRLFEVHTSRQSLLAGLLEVAPTFTARFTR